jgi:DNA-binding PadR family transcriptional regulator
MVLGIVASQPEVHGYYVYRELVNWRAESWNSVLPGSIYHAISQLEKEDLLEKRTTEKSSSGPEKTCYAITEDGRREFLRLIKESLI